MNLPPATILSIGAVTPLGRDLVTISQRLSEPPPAPSLRRVNDDDLSSPATQRQLRRADRFVRMASVAALDACTGQSMDGVGLIVTSGLGPHGRGFKFLDGILDCGDAAALPTDFSHSVHGVAASYIAGLLDLRGPTLTATDFEFGVEQAVLLAQCWIARGTCGRVLVGAVEELGDVLIHCASRMIPEPVALGEGAVFLMLGPADQTGIATIDSAAAPREVDLAITDSPQAMPPFRARRTINFTPYFGLSASSIAFGVLAGLLTEFDNAATFRTSCPRAASLLLNRRKN